MIDDGAPPFAIASIDGGNTYWHGRRTGEDAGRLVVEEFVPLLAERGLSTRKVGLFGWSMGGFGAPHLARTLGPDRVAVVIAESPALWLSAAETPEGAFEAGGHDLDYWRRMAPAQLRFAALHLES